MRDVLLIIMLCGAIACGRASDTVSKEFHLNRGEKYVISLDGDTMSRSVEVCVAAKGNRNSSGMGKAEWRLTWADADGRPLRLLEVKWGNEGLVDAFDRRFLRLTVDSITVNGVAVRLLEQKLFDNVALYGGDNTIAIDEKDGSMDVWIGNDLEYFVGECGAAGNATQLCLDGTVPLDIKYVAVTSEPSFAAKLGARWNPEELNEYISSHNSSVEGLWEFLDRDNNMKLASPGGKYGLSVVKYDSSRSGDILDLVPDYEDKMPAYEILYMSGAEVNADEWCPAMVKGLLYPTVFENHFDLVWFDAYMEPMAGEQWADFVQGSILSLNFPLLRAQMRFSKVPNMPLCR